VIEIEMKTISKFSKKVSKYLIIFGELKAVRAVILVLGVFWAIKLISN
jgi:hypothetical protein